MQTKSLDQLYSELEQIKELLRFSKLFNGKIESGGVSVTTAELEEQRTSIKAEITSRVSQANLRIVK